MSAVLASFMTEAALLNALDRLRSAGFEDVETFTPVPVEDLKPRGIAGLLPMGIFLSGVAGAGFMLGLECLSTVSGWGYPIDIGGRPKFSWPAYMPISVAFGILCAAAAGLLLHTILNTGWRLWDPVDEFEEMPGATRDRWIVQVHAEEERELLRASVVLAVLQPIAVHSLSPEMEEVPA
jgi:hypothetical protein